MVREPNTNHIHAQRGHRSMPANLKYGERWITDSGSGYHLVGERALTDKESLLIGITYHQHRMETAGGITYTDEKYPVDLSHLGINFRAIALESCPNASYAGELCDSKSKGVISTESPVKHPS